MEQLISILVVIEVMDVVIERPAILPPTIVMTMVSLIMKVLKFIRVIEDMDMGLLRPNTIPFFNNGV